MQLGDAATWVASIGTVGAVVVALRQIKTERDVRKERETQEVEARRRGQANGVFAWISEEASTEATVLVLNQSAGPIFEVIVSLVAYQGAGARDGRETQSRYRSYLSIAPPGLHSVVLAGGYRGMSFHPAIEVAFRDGAGVNWVRSGSGELAELRANAVAHYGLPLPLPWQLPAIVRTV